MTLTNPTEILNEEYRYYKNLYTSASTNPDKHDLAEFFDSSTLPKLTPRQADNYNGLLTKKECFTSLKQFSKGMLPCSDSRTAEFYLAFWELLGQELVDSLNYAFQMGELSISQKREIITLIPNKNKNRALLDHWRPISLLNTDYKIATKAIATRISKVLPFLITGDQTSFIKGRRITQNVRLIADIIECTESLNISGITLFLDFKKAFDSIEWSFIFRALETFGFGSPLIQWIRTFYHNLQSCFVNNGHVTPFFEFIEGGVRQGCPLSAILFVIAVEFLADSIRNDQSIEGIIIKGKEHKISQYADDTSCFVSGLNSIQKLF